jgi:beta-lactamase regulating signal transducer with metallopeptidase domain
VSALLTWVAHGSVLVALASLAMCGRRGPNAATRYLCWWAVMAALLALPVAHALASPFGAPAVPAEALGALDSAPSAAMPLALILPHQFAVAAPWLAASVGVLMLWRLFALAQAASRLRRVRASCLPLPDGLEAQLPLWCAARDGRRQVRLLATIDLQTPSVLGVPPGERGLPIIALPLWTIESLDAESLDLIVLHELAHIERGDDRDLLIQAAITAVFCWHPAVWWVGRWLDEERERACDDEVVRRTHRAAQYARCLVGVAAHVGPGPTLLAAPGVGRAGRRLARRVERLLIAEGSPSGPRARTLRLTWVSTVLTGLASAVVVSAAGAPRVHVPEPNWDSMRTSSMASLVPAVVFRPSPAAVRGSESPLADLFGSSVVRLTRRPGQAALEAAPVAQGDVADERDRGLPPESVPPAEPEPQVVASAATDRSAPVPSIAGDLHSVGSILDLPVPTMPAPSLPAAPAAGPWKRTANAGESIGKGTAGAGKSIGKGAAQAGESIGKASAQAGVKTAGFFSRMGRAVASSF